MSLWIIFLSILSAIPANAESNTHTVVIQDYGRPLGFFDEKSNLLNKEIDAYSASFARDSGLLKETNTFGSVKSVGDPVGVVNRAIAIRKDRAELIGIINDAVNKLLQSPIYNEIRKKWYPEELQ